MALKLKVTLVRSPIHREESPEGRPSAASVCATFTTRVSLRTRRRSAA